MQGDARSSKELSELSWTKKNSSAKKMFKVGDEIDCVITEIDKSKRRVQFSKSYIITCMYIFNKYRITIFANIFKYPFINILV